MSLVAACNLFAYSISSLGKILTHLIIFPFNPNYIQLHFRLTFAEWFVRVTEPHIHVFFVSVICSSSESSDYEDAERKGHFLKPKNICDLLSEVSIRMPAENSWAVKDVIAIIGWNCAQIGCNHIILRRVHTILTSVQFVQSYSWFFFTEIILLKIVLRIFESAFIFWHLRKKSFYLKLCKFGPTDKNNISEINTSWLKSKWRL